MPLLLLRLPRLALLLGRALHIGYLNAVLLPRWALVWTVLLVGRHDLRPVLLWWSLPSFISLDAKAGFGEEWREVFVEDGLGLAGVRFCCVLLVDVWMTLYLDASSIVRSAQPYRDPLPAIR